ncbi:EAL domain-containing protein, partial [Caballeronia sp. BR00000012568055]|uniref:EAL and HDOD domain-containing protein n=1 Tax=Caballeronia sp. BR00000012568055 TaxID=2918761 RepID=UPI0023F81F72
MSIFVARQPIVNRRGSVVAQELLFRDAQSQRANISDGFRCSAAVVERVLGAFGLEQVLDGTDGYLNTPAELIFSDVLELLPASRFTLEILEDEALTPDLGAQCDRLRQAGFRIALDDVNAITPEIERFLQHVDIVKLDWPYIDPKAAQETVRRCRRAGKLVLAEKVEERADHARAMQAGVDLFQGYHFAKPQLLSSKREVASFAGVSKVLQLIMEDASHLHLEQALKSVPPLVVQVLRLANSGRSSRARQA